MLEAPQTRPVAEKVQAVIVRARPTTRRAQEVGKDLALLQASALPVTRVQDTVLPWRVQEGGSARTGTRALIRGPVP